MIRDLAPPATPSNIIPKRTPETTPETTTQTGNIQPGKNQLGKVLQDDTTQEIAQARTDLKNGARNAARIMAKVIGNDTGRAWIIENALKQPYSMETLQTAAIVIIQALAETRGRRVRKQERMLRIVDRWRTKWKRNKSRPILPLACEILSAFERKRNQEIMDELMETADEICDHLQGNDLAGPTIQKLFHNRKDVASYHTIPECAALLAALAITPDRDWRTAKIADFTAGAGILPMAAYKQIRELHLREGGNSKDKVDTKELHRELLEHGIFMADMMPASLAIATSNLVNMEPGSPVRRIQAMRMHYGVEQKKDGARTLGLGSLDFMGKKSPKIPGSPPASSNRKAWLDLVLSNPPYTKSMKHGELDQNMPNAEAGVPPTTKEELQHLDRMSREIDQSAGATGNTGIGYHFATMAQKFVKRGGIIALTLPASCLTSNIPSNIPRKKGPTRWQKFRKTLARNYRDINVLSITHYNQRNSAMSHDTQIAEVMIIARRLEVNERAPGTMNLINLKRRPTNDRDAMNIAEAVRSTILSIDQSTGEPAQESRQILMGDEDLGIIIRTKIPGNEPWPLSQVSQPGLIDAALSLNMGIIRSSKYTNRTFSFPVRTMGKLGQVSVHVDQNSKIFEQKDEPENSGKLGQTGNPVEERPFQPFMDGHSCHRDRTINAVPNDRRPVRKGLENKALLIQKQKASGLHLSDSFRYNSQSVQAIYTDIPSLGGRGWPNVKMEREIEERATAVWMNTTMGMVTQWALSSHIQKGLGSLTKGQLENMPTLNLKALTEDQLHEMDRIFTEALDRPFLAANESWRDPMRIDLDQKVITRVLNMGPEATLAVQHIRDQWCLEPTVQGNKGSARARSQIMETLRRRVEDPQTPVPADVMTPAFSSETTAILQAPTTSTTAQSHLTLQKGQGGAEEKPAAEIRTRARCNVLNNPRPKIRFTANSIKSWKKARRRGPEENLPRRLKPIYQVEAIPSEKGTP